MDGRIVSVKEVETEDGYGYREIRIKIPEPPMPYQPTEWVLDWRAVEEQQPQFNEDMKKMFAEYEVAMRQYDRYIDRLGALHIGGVSVTQTEEVKE